MEYALQLHQPARIIELYLQKQEFFSKTILKPPYYSWHFL